MPKIVAVQTAICSPLADKFFNMEKRENEYSSNSIAEGIAIVNAPRSEQIIDAVIKTNGTFLKVTEDEIKNTWKKMAQTGFYIEPTSAATIAGVEKYIIESKNNYHQHGNMSLQQLVLWLHEFNKNYKKFSIFDYYFFFWFLISKILSFYLI